MRWRRRSGRSTNQTTSVEGALLAVNLGDDADTTGAVYGQIAGAHYGAEAIPPEWRSKLAMADTITAMADALYNGVRDGTLIRQMFADPSGHRQGQRRGEK